MATAATANRIRNKVKLMAIHVAYNLPYSNSATRTTKETEIDSLWQTETEAEPVAGIYGKAKANKFLKIAIKKSVQQK